MSPEEILEKLLGKTSEEQIQEKIKIICNCRAIRKARVAEAISKGADTVEKVNGMAQTGKGPCGATRCRPRILEMLRQVGYTPKS